MQGDWLVLGETRETRWRGAIFGVAVREVHGPAQINRVRQCTHCSLIRQLGVGVPELSSLPSHRFSIDIHDPVLR